MREIKHSDVMVSAGFNPSATSWLVGGHCWCFTWYILRNGEFVQVYIVPITLGIYGRHWLRFDVFLHNFPKKICFGWQDSVWRPMLVLAGSGS